MEEPATRRDDSNTHPEIYKTTIPPDSETAEYDLVELIAERNGTQIDQLPPLYTQIDHMVEQLFKNPPSPEAQVELSFSYCGSRVTLTQEGQLTIVPVKASIPEGGPSE
jgi:hypothetical protein